MQHPSSPLTVRSVSAFADNYIWLIESPRSPGQLVAVDPGDAAPVLRELDRSGQSLAAILLTHHHPDHIGGVEALLDVGDIPVVGPHDPRIPHCTRPVGDGQHCALTDLGLDFEVLAVPGHTSTHIAYVGHGVLFSGDTLFSAGCGRMFEGTPAQMSGSLDRLRALPPDTRMYCGHEYTAANLRFALTVEPDNTAAQDHQAVVARARAASTPSVPSPLALEREINPFLRCDTLGVRAAAERHAGKPLPLPADVFAVLRSWKDEFR